MNMKPPRFNGWIATLSDGSTKMEQPQVSGERTSWQKLITYLNENKIKITGLRLQKGPITFHALPPKLCDGYYQAYEARITMFTDVNKNLQGIGSVVGELVYITWISDDGNIYQDIRPLLTEKPHTTLRE